MYSIFLAREVAFSLPMSEKKALVGDKVVNKKVHVHILLFDARIWCVRHSIQEILQFMLSLPKISYNLVIYLEAAAIYIQREFSYKQFAYTCNAINAIWGYAFNVKRNFKVSIISFPMPLSSIHSNFSYGKKISVRVYFT